MTRYFRTIGLAAGAACVSVVIAACGGGGDASDEEYVTAFCNAHREFSTTLSAAVRGASTTSSFDAIAEPFTRLADDFDDMDAPDDLKEWHDGVVDRLDGTAKRVREEKNLQAVTSSSNDPLETMPQEPRERLRDVAQDDPACEGVNVFDG